MQQQDLLDKFQAVGETPNSVTFSNILPAYARIGFLHAGKEIHARSIRTGSAFDLFVSNALTDLDIKIFDRVPIKDVASWNTMILGYRMLGELDTAIRLFEAMRMDGVDYDSVVLSACRVKEDDW
ncbi:hypothetical protein C3L33_05980, partial [Rhododendron williamsianum]